MGSLISPTNMTAIGGGVSALGSIMGGVSASRSDKYNAKVAEENAALAKQNAAFEGAIGESNVGLAGLKTKQEFGAIKAAQAAHGVDVNTGSAKAVQNSQAETGMLNAANIRSNAARQAYGFEVQATGYENQANLDKASARNDIYTGIGNAGAGLIKTAGQINTYGGGDGPTADSAARYVASSPAAQVDTDVKSESLLGGSPSSSSAFNNMLIDNGLFNAGSTG